MTTQRSTPTRYPLLDLLKAVAAQCIVLHHFSAYGPVSGAAQQAAPAMISALYEYGRMAVQVFLVVAGYLAARGLAGQGALSKTARPPWAIPILNRFLRLLGPYLVAVLAAVVCAALARQVLNDDFIPATPTWPQLLAHVGLLHGVLGYDALSSGVWYIAIDFQLFALFTLLCWASGQHRRLTQGLVALLCVASLYTFNRDATLDNWAVYFFGAYGLGALAWWAGQTRPPDRFAKALFLLVMLAALGALVLDFRLRIALAMAVAIALAVGGHHTQRLPAPWGGWIEYLSQTSYALFLVHFSVLLLLNALFAWQRLAAPGTALVTMATGWALSLLAAHFFHRWVERPMGRWRWGKRD